MKRPNENSRGAALPLAMILLAVLTVVAVAAVSLSTQERSNAAAYSRVDFVQECANAAQAKLWAEMAQFGLGYLGAAVQVTELRLPDGTRLVSPAHFGSRQANGSYPLVKDLILKVASTGTGEINERDCTNSACGLVPLGGTHIVQAHCVDPSGRELELELGIKFAL